MSHYDPIPDLCWHIRRLAELWAKIGLDFHPAYAAALAAADKAERWAEERRLVEAEAR